MKLIRELWAVACDILGLLGFALIGLALLVIALEVERLFAP